MVNAFLTHKPSPGNVNTPFGPRPKPTESSPAIHYGLDYGWGNGKTIYAAAAGKVTSTALSGAYGNRTRIDHGNGRETWYCHQSSISVKAGDQVAGGQAIGVQGATGNVVGVHLHFEVRINGVAVDPAPLFLTASVTPAGSGTTTSVGELSMADMKSLEAQLSGIAERLDRQTTPEVQKVHAELLLQFKALNATLEANRTGTHTRLDKDVKPALARIEATLKNLK